MLLPILLLVVLIGFFLYYILLLPVPKPKWWEKHGVREIDVSQISNWDILLGKRSIIDRDDLAYKLMGNDKFCGILESPSPIILVKDIDLIKKIMIKDFDHFVDRRDFWFIPESSILRQMMVMMKGNKWRSVRSTLTPTFSTGKIRRMMNSINLVGNQWINSLQKKCTSKHVKIDVVDTLNRYTLDVIACAVFGMSVVKTTEGSNSTILSMANRVTQMSTLEIIRQNLSPRYPKIFKLFDIEPVDTTALNFFEKIMTQEFKSRCEKPNDIPRNDFLQLLVELRKGRLEGLEGDELSNFEKESIINDKRYQLSDRTLIAQGVQFFLAGLQTTTTFLSNVLHVLAIHQDVQEKLRKEVSQVFNESDSLDFDNLNKLVYMDMVFNEVLRLFPIGQRLERIATKDYHDPVSGLCVPKGTVICFPVKSIQRDPLYYPNPDTFDPENFSTDNKTKRNPYAFLGFGIGPRSCIGMRFAIAESKAAVARLIKNFRLEPTAETPVPIRVIPAGVTIAPVYGLELKLIPVV